MKRRVNYIIAMLIIGLICSLGTPMCAVANDNEENTVVDEISGDDSQSDAPTLSEDENRMEESQTIENEVNSETVEALGENQVSTYSTTSTSNKNYYYYTVKNIPYGKVDVVRLGKISAEKINGVWFYKFSYNGVNVYISVSALKKENSVNSTSYINDDFSNCINSRIPNPDQYYVYNHRSVGKDKKVYARRTYEKSYYIWQLSKYYLEETFDSRCITLYMKKTGGFTLSFHPYFWKDNFKKFTQPSTASEYMKCISRKSYNNDGVRPVFTIAIQTPGKNKTYLNTYGEMAKGYTFTRGTVNNADLIKVGYKTTVCAASAATGTISPKTCLGAAIDGAKLLLKFSKKYEYKTYNWGAERRLSGSKIITLYYNNKTKKWQKKYIKGAKTKKVREPRYVYSSEFKSPLLIRDTGNEYQVRVKLNPDISYENVRTNILIKFGLSR